MKLFFLIVAVITLSGCAAPHYRTGRLAVNQFSVDGCRTNDTTLVSDEDLTRMSAGLRKAVLASIFEQTRMTPAADCSNADFELTGRFHEVKAEENRQWQVLSVKVTQKYDIAVTGELKQCRTGQVVAGFDAGEEGQELSSIIEKVAQQVARQVATD